MSEANLSKKRMLDPLAARCIKAAKRIENLAGTARRSELADLRRLGRPSHPVPGQVAWKFIDEYSTPDDERIWPIILPLMTRVFHVSGSLGRALQEAEISPARLERWLRRDRRTALGDARLLILRAEKGLPWGAMGRLLHEWTPELRGEVARDFFRAKREATRSGTSTSNTTDS